MIYADGVLTFIFADGEVVTFAVKEPFKIVIGDYEARVGNSVEIPYTIVGATGEVIVLPVTPYDDYADMFYIEEHIEETPYSGRIIVHQSWDTKEVSGKLGIFAVDESGTTVSKIIRLTSSVMYVDDEKYLVGPEASAISVKVAANRKYDVSTSADWITYVETKAVEERTLVFDIKKNDGFYRNAEIYITSGKKKITVPVYQRASGDQLFYVKHTISAPNYYNDSFSVLVGDGNESIKNSKGQTVAEALGYESWDEVVEAAGNLETIRSFAGDVVITAFDPMTGKSYGFKDYKYRWNSDGPEYWFDKNCKLDEYNDWLVFNWDVRDNKLTPDFDVFLYSDYMLLPGDSYILGIMLSSETADVRIEVAIEVEDYTDPEEGKYNDPVSPGKYTFDIDEQFDIQTILPEDSSPVTHIPNSEVYETIKSTLGMTSYDLYRIRNEVEDYFLFDDEHLYGTNSYSFYMDISSSPVDYYDNGYEQRILQVYWNPFSMEPQRNNLQFNTFYETGKWNSYVINAADKGTTLKFRYVLKYGGYELVFNFNIKFELIESEDPEAGLYENPKAPGTYQFDIYDKIQISNPEFTNNYVYNREFYEKIKETLGMTAYEISMNSLKFETSWRFTDNSTGEEDYYWFNPQSYAAEYEQWQSSVVRVEWQIGASNAANNWIQMSMPYNYGKCEWQDWVIAAAEAGKEIKYSYVIKYKDYELIFNHTIEFEKTEYNDPEAGLYENPKAPGTYEFDIVDEYVISKNDAGKDSQTFDEMAYKQTSDVWTIIRQTLGMTSSELYIVRNDAQFYLILNDGSRQNNTWMPFDMNGQQSSQIICSVSSYYCHSHVEDNNYRWASISWAYNSQSGGYDWLPSVYDAAENNAVITYKSVMEYGEYKLIFNHSIKFRMAE